MSRPRRVHAAQGPCHSADILRRLARHNKQSQIPGLTPPAPILIRGIIADDIEVCEYQNDFRLNAFD